MTAAARVAREIEVEIVRRGWPVGESLGSEAQLMARYAVGRGAVREAVRILEDRQLVRPREGRSGGLVITAPDLDGVAAAVRAFLWHGQVRAEHLHEVWSTLVTNLVGDVARGLDPPGADELGRVRGFLPRQGSTAWSPVALHTQLLRPVQNPPAVLVLRAALDAWGPEVVGVAAVQRAGEQHTRLLDDVLRGDAVAAQTRAQTFFDAHPAASFGPLDMAARAPVTSGKLGPRVAEQLLAEVQERGWPVGGALGTERELQDRLGVSRAGLREAVRLLESWSVVRARRGNGGGLSIVAPDPASLRDAGRAWLDHAGTTRRAVFAVRLPLEALAVRSLVAAVTPEAVARLRDVLVAERDSGGAYVTRGPDVLRPSLSTEIARLCGNPALALFVPLLLDLVRARGLRVDRPESAARWVEGRHQDLVAAIAAGDGVRAELLVRRYVAAVERVAPLTT